MSQRKLFSSVLLIGLFASFLGQAVAAPRLSISANRARSANGITVVKNERVSLQISTDDGASLAVFCVPKIAYLQSPDGKEITFYATTSAVFMVASFKDKTVSKQEFVISVSGTPEPTPPGPGPGPSPPDPTPPKPNPNPPDPGPGPGPKPPNPKPEPVVPTSKVGKAIYDAAILVKSTTRVADIKVLTDGFNAIKSKAAATSSYTYEQILVDAFKVFKDIKPDASKKEWQAFSIAMLTTYRTNMVADKASLITALGETILGLEAAAFFEKKGGAK